LGFIACPHRRFRSKRKPGARASCKESNPLKRALSQKGQDFAELYVLTGNAAHAYRIVYARDPNAKAATCANGASKLMRQRKVQRHIQEIRTRHRKRNDVTIDAITDKLHAAYDMAFDQKNPASMIRAAIDIAKLHGLVVEKREIAFRDIDKMDDAELRGRSDELDALIAIGKKRLAELQSDKTIH